MAEEAQKQTSTDERRPGQGTVSLMPWNNTSTSATRAVIAIGLLIAVPFLAALIYGTNWKRSTSSQRGLGRSRSSSRCSSDSW
jgi:hypothetical protein